LPRRRPELGEGLATVIFTNFKGGSAKTTSCVHFAQYLARAGYRVLLIDLDSQASATAQFGIDPFSEVGLGDSFAAWTNARDEGRMLAAKSICQRTYWSSIDLVPGGAVLAQAEESLSRRSANRRVEEAFGQDLDTCFSKVMVTAYDPTDRSQEALVSLIRERFGDAVLPGEFLHSRIMGTAGFGKETLYEYEPSTDRVGYNRVLASANNVNQAIEQEVHRAWGRGHEAGRDQYKAARI
jgi:cellulose biosynthesis protein BcsQ